MPRYRAKHPLYLDLRYIEVGEAFESDLDPGKNWEPLDDAARAASAKRFPSGPPVDEKNIIPGPRLDLPENWRDLPTPQIIALARKFGAPAKGTGAQAAIAWIEREEFNRAGTVTEKAAA